MNKEVHWGVGGGQGRCREMCWGVGGGKERYMGRAWESVWGEWGSV